MNDTFTCVDCKLIFPVLREGGTGYAGLPDGGKVCYGCCAHRDRSALIADGHSKHLPLLPIVYQ